jgi:hypothetical protein
MSSGTAPSEAGTAGGARIGAGLLALIAYQVLAHWAVTSAPACAAAMLMALAPVALAALWSGFRRGTAGGLAAAGVLAGVAVLAGSLRYRWFTHASIAQSLGAFRRLYRSAPADPRPR